MILHLTEAEVQEAVLHLAEKRIPGAFNTVKLECSYSGFTRAVLSFEQPKEKSDEQPANPGC